MVSVLPWSVVDRGFEHRLVIDRSSIGHRLIGQTKDYKLGYCCFSAKHAALISKSKDWLTRNQDNVSEWGDMSNGLLFQ